MNKAGSPQTKGMEVVNEGLSRHKCLERCEEHHAATGCEYISEKRECTIHTFFVKVTPGRETGLKTKYSCIAFGM